MHFPDEIFGVITGFLWTEYRLPPHSIAIHDDHLYNVFRAHVLYHNEMYNGWYLNYFQFKRSFDKKMRYL